MASPVRKQFPRPVKLWLYSDGDGWPHRNGFCLTPACSPSSSLAESWSSCRGAAMATAAKASGPGGRHGGALGSEVFSVRLVCVDYYMAPPLPGMDTCYSAFQGRGVDQVPVVRIYGSTLGGQKTCLHLHKAFPYFYVIYDEDLPQHDVQAMMFMKKLALALEKGLKLANSTARKKQYVHGCGLVRGLPFYGFHPGERLFMKLVLYHPQDVSRAVSILQSGALLNRKFQPYEAHIPYLLQLMVDYNLSGMSHVRLTRIRFRGPLPDEARQRSHVSDLVKALQAADEEIASISGPSVVLRYDNDGGSGMKHSENGAEARVEYMGEERSKTAVDDMVGIDIPVKNVGEERSSGITLRTSADDAPTFENFPLATPPLTMDFASPVTPAEQRNVEGKERIEGTCDWNTSPQGATGKTNQKDQINLTAAEEKIQYYVKRNVPLSSVWSAVAMAGSSRFGFTKQSLCELEVDASVDDIMNRAEVRNVPLEQAGPECQMVPSLAPIWEDERRRSGSAASVPTSTQNRVIPSPSDHERALKKAVNLLAEEDALQIARLQQQQEDGKGDPQQLKSNMIQMYAEDQKGTPKEGNKLYSKEQYGEALREEEREDGKVFEARGVQYESNAGDKVPKGFKEDGREEDGEEGLVDANILSQVSQQQLCSQVGEKEELELLELLRHLEGSETIFDSATVGVNIDAEKWKGLEDAEIASEIVASQLTRGGISTAVQHVLAEIEEATQREVDDILAGMEDEVETEGEDEEGKENACKERMPDSFDLGGNQEMKDVVGNGESEDGKQTTCERIFGEAKEERNLESGHTVFKSWTIPQTDGAADDIEDDERWTGVVPRVRDLKKTKRKTNEHKQRALGEVKEQNNNSSSGIHSSTWGMLPLAGVDGSKEERNNLEEKAAIESNRSLEEGKGQGKESMHESCDVVKERDKQVSNEQNWVLQRWKRELEEENVQRQIDAVGRETPGMMRTSKVLEDVQSTRPEFHFTKVEHGSRDLSVRDLMRKQRLRRRKRKLSDGVRIGREGNVQEIVIPAEGKVLNGQQKEHDWGGGEAEPMAFNSEIRRDRDRGDVGRMRAKRSRERCEENFGGEGMLQQELGEKEETVSAKLELDGNTQEHEDLDFAAELGLVLTPLIADLREHTSSGREEFGRVESGVCRTPNSGKGKNLNVERPKTSLDDAGEAVEEMGKNSGVSEKAERNVRKRNKSGALDLVESMAKAGNEKPSLVNSVPRLTLPKHDDISSRSETMSLLDVTKDCNSEVRAKSHLVMPINSSLIALRFHQPPPNRKSLEESWQEYGMTPVDWGRVFYGDPTDVPDRPVVLGGMEFRVRTQEVWDLPLFTFGIAEHKGYFKDTLPVISKAPTYIQANNHSAVGTILSLQYSPRDYFYPLSPSQPPPSRASISKWLKQNQSSSEKEPLLGKTNLKLDKQEPGFTIDPNTGKLLVLHTVGGGAGVEKGEGTVEETEEDLRFLRPSSPKYDERHVMSTPLLLTSDHSPSHRFRGSPLPSPIGRAREMLPYQQSISQRKLLPSPSPVENSVLEVLQRKTSKDDRDSTQPPKSPPVVKSPSDKKDLLVSSMPPPRSRPKPKRRDEKELQKKSNDSPPRRQHIGESERQKAAQIEQKDIKESTVFRGKQSIPGVGLPQANPWRDISQITPPSPAKVHMTPVSQLGFRSMDRGNDGGQQLTVMSLEIHASSRGNLQPDPRYDEIGCIIICLGDDTWEMGSMSNHEEDKYQSVLLLVDNDLSKLQTGGKRKNRDGLRNCHVISLLSEKSMFNCFVDFLRTVDPDIVVGWEIQGASLGYLAERAANLGFGLLNLLSRIQSPGQNSRGRRFHAAKADSGGGATREEGFLKPAKQDGHTKAGEECGKRNDGLEDDTFVEANEREKSEGKEKEWQKADAGLRLADVVHLPTEVVGLKETIVEDEWGRTHGSGIHITGRIVLNLWRVMQGEVKLPIYTLEAVAEAVLRRRVTRFPWRQLTAWFNGGAGRSRWRCIKYWLERARLNLQIMDQLDLVNRTAELARVFGIDFFSVLSRGSQFRVESMMLRLCRTQNYLLLSPSRLQVAQQPAMQCLPLVMEPESRLYTSPVVVLDFQSLYPSMIIAYNLCFSTCLGRITRANPKRMGVMELYSLQAGVLAALKDCLHLLPNGVMYAPPEVRPGVLPRLLQEILTTRIMVKAAMKKLQPSQKVLQRVLNARQFALKLIANVTYGYTAAGFSGRMPCAELADSIVQAGRATLERAIACVNASEKWNAKVVYGDTDSMFVLLEGRTREEAFRIGQEIAACVTAENPPPVVLKMEKVYHPCFLLMKKRYVGYSYEHPQQKEPTFDAKGIETVRRDSCPAVSKAMEKTLRIIFETRDLSQVKAYLQRQCGRILSGRVSIRDFIFAKEVRLGSYSTRSAVLPPAAIVASKAMDSDPRAEPRYGERVPYVVVYGEPGARLVDLVVDPHVLVDNSPILRLHGTYYINKQIIPALQRVFGLVGADLKSWLAEMPRIYRSVPVKRPSALLLQPNLKEKKASVWKGGENSKHEGFMGTDGQHFPVDNNPGSKKARVGGRASGFVKGLYFGASNGASHGGGTIDQYYLSQHCAVCGGMMRAMQTLCGRCHAEPQMSATVLTQNARKLERELSHLVSICRHCGGDDGMPGGVIACTSLDCPVFFERRKVQSEARSACFLAAGMGFYPEPLY